MELQVKKRLESLDVLRGFDLFCLLALETTLHPLANALKSPVFNDFMWAFTHVSWEGFSSWDLVMPLFLFMSGITIPFSLSRVKSSGSGKLQVYKRVLKRFAILWILGMICQGNLLALDAGRIYLFSNTLQAIAVGYLVSAVLYINIRASFQIAIALALLAVYWLLMQFVTVNGYGGGDYTPQGNLAEYIDRLVLGRFRDGAGTVDGIVVFAPWYWYTWILSSMNFVVTVMSGMFAGEILRSSRPAMRKFYMLLAIGIASVAAGYLLSFQQPIIKTIWTSTMTLYSSGLCFILMALFYLWIDVWGHRKHNTMFKVYGMNSITGYMLTCAVSFSSIPQSLFFGLQQYTGDFYPFLIAVADVVIIYLILLWMYKKNIFLKV